MASQSAPADGGGGGGGGYSGQGNRHEFRQVIRWAKLTDDYRQTDTRTNANPDVGNFTDRQAITGGGNGGGGRRGGGGGGGANCLRLLSSLENLKDCI